MPRNGIYRVTRFNWDLEKFERLGHFAVVDGAVVFFSWADKQNFDFINEGPISGYMAGRIQYMLKNYMGTAGLHLKVISTWPTC